MSNLSDDRNTKLTISDEDVEIRWYVITPHTVRSMAKAVAAHKNMSMSAFVASVVKDAYVLYVSELKVDQ